MRKSTTSAIVAGRSDQQKDIHPARSKDHAELRSRYFVCCAAEGSHAGRKAQRFKIPSRFHVPTLTQTEAHNLKSQFVTSSWGGPRRARPYAFTEQGVAMLSSVLRSP